MFFPHNKMTLQGQQGQPQYKTFAYNSFFFLLLLYLFFVKRVSILRFYFYIYKTHKGIFMIFILKFIITKSNILL